jgi:streptogramin lyase
MDAFFAYLYRLDADSSELCKYTLPADGMTDYVVREEGYLWLGDRENERILRLQVSDGDLTWWQLPEGSTPFGMAVDQPGHVWFIDRGQNAIVMLNPSTNQLRTFSLPVGDYPKMIAIQSGFIWYTEDGLASIGRLDPLTASYSSETLNHDSQTLEPSCASIDPSSTGTLEVTSGDLSWSDASLLTLVDADGWRIYQMPEDAYPWGITIPALGYVVDSGRQQLVRFTPPTDTTLTVIKHVVNDSGGTAVASDFTLTVTNAGADPSSFPGAESPGTQVTLQPGAYSVTEEGPDGYSATYSEGCSGTITPGQSKTCTITNDDIPGGYNIFLPIIVR